ncbi:FAD:protein FMN transferase [Verrucomicrobium sp. BvORR106]|uniref:FAD:protein FMN transferase n=1 Tax=Verrucomicrobium sp. BvORR106 TaxID=1403819 RepID=UPI00068EB701|nr:FAD:protein FMN transferase [Verrucomicrobium sp. BvORR106]
MAEISRSQPLLGTLVRITLRDAAMGADGLHQLADDAFAAITRVQALMSWFDPQSDVSRINARAHREEVEVHPCTAHVLREARRFSQLSDGAFDITITPVLTGWGLRPTRKTPRSASLAGNWEDVQVTVSNQVFYTRPVQVDLGGIAKGYAVDRAVAALAHAAPDFALVDASGDMRYLGNDPPQLRLRDPEAPYLRSTEVPFLKRAVATSAAYASTRRKGWRRVNHLVHPQTRKPAPTHASATVFADTCLQADALSKVALFAPPETLASALQDEAAVIWPGSLAEAHPAFGNFPTPP